MLGYPLMWGLSQTNLDRNLQHYRAVLPDSSPSTAWSMLAINELENGKESLAQDAFHKSYKDYVKEPFKVDIDKKFTIANSPSQLVHLDLIFYSNSNTSFWKDFYTSIWLDLA